MRLSCAVAVLLLGSTVFAGLDWEQTISRRYFWCGLYVVPAYVFLRIVAAKIYASSLLRSLQTGTLNQSVLSEIETVALQKLDLFERELFIPRHPLVRAVTWSGGLAARFGAGFAAALLWFAAIAQSDYVAQFLHYRPAAGWLNHALLQLPWFLFLP